MKQLSGFTIIELIVVISVLGILTATVLPKFAGLREDAHAATVSGTGAAFAAALSMVKAKSIAKDIKGATAADDGTNSTDCPSVGTMGGNTLRVNFERGICARDNDTNALNTAGCVLIWDQIIDGQSVVASPATNADYTALLGGSTCTYTYNGQANLSLAYTMTNVDDDNGVNGLIIDDNPDP